MSEFKLYDNIMKIGFGIEACLELKLDLPALVLIYSGIDVAGWLASSKEYSGRSTFIDWINNYLLPAKPLKCNALDLYAARCGILHSLTPYSQPFRRGRPRLMCYAYGNARAEDVQQTIIDMKSSDRYVAVHVNELFEAWRLGLLRFVEELESDHGKKELVYAKAKKFFSTMRQDILDLARAEFERRR
jgi:hypothetical protein